MISRFLISAIAGLALGVSAANAEQSADKAPNWKRAPSQQDFLTVFPTAAMEAGKGGKVVLLCRITVTGAPTGCTFGFDRQPDQGRGGFARELQGAYPGCLDRYAERVGCVGGLSPRGEKPEAQWPGHT